MCPYAGNVLVDGVTFVSADVFDGWEGYTVNLNPELDVNRIDITTPNNDPMVKAAYQIMEDSGMACELTADEDSLIYNFTITDETMAETLTKDVLDPQLSQMASTFENIGSVLPSMVEGLDNPSIIVRYLGPDGTEITSMEFFASDTE